MQKIVAEIVSAYLKKNTVAATELPDLIRSVYASLNTIREPLKPDDTTPSAPATSIRASIKPDYLVCLDCGQHAKMLKRHLTNAHNLTPDSYRARWNLKSDYPMTAPAYAKQRSALAVSLGLGTSNRGKRLAEKNT